MTDSREAPVLIANRRCYEQQLLLSETIGCIFTCTEFKIILMIESLMDATLSFILDSNI